jgi:subtilisin-like proprotein convertase family protein
METFIGGYQKKNLYKQNPRRINKMKQHLFTLIAVVTAAIISLPLLSFSQSLDPSIPGPVISDSRPSNGQSGEGIEINRVENHHPVTDEYGETSGNGVLTGLGAAGNYVNVAHNTAFNQDVDGSVECWVNLSAYNASSTVLISKSATSSTSFMLGVGSATNMLFFRIGTTVWNATSNVIPLNVWTHCAAVWTGGPSSFTLTFYVNGVASGTVGPTAATWNVNTDPVRIGGSQGFPGSFTNGQIDEVRFWEPARTLAQIRDNRFVGIGDGAGANSGSAITSGAHYTGCIASWVFNTTGTAWEDISGFDGTYVGTATSTLVLGSQPIPYNFALQCPGTGNPTSRVDVPNNAAFTLTSQGTAEAWVYFLTLSTQEVISKSATTNTQYMFGVTGTGALYMRFGTTPTINSGAGLITLATNTWYHVAWTWTGSPGNYQVRYYVNGQQSGVVATNTGTMNSTTDPLTIGGGQAFTSETVNGYVDEVRLWNVARSLDQIKWNMSNSVRSAALGGAPIGAWNFDGNLINWGSTAGINGTLSTGGTNNCRFSGFLNETSTGAPSLTFNAHPTVVNRRLTSNPFSGGFAVRAPNKPIVDVATTRDTITFPSGGALTSVELFLHIQHTFCADLDIVLRAPNGQTRDISSDNGSGNDGGYLTFFVDGVTPLVSDVTFFPPYSNLAGPEVAMGTMGGTGIAGNWILEITDDLGGDVGVLLGWGLRINNSVTGIEPVAGNVPGKFGLYQNYPNPFNPMTNIKFDLPKDVNVKIAVYDIIGREVRTLVNQFSKAGSYEIPFDGSNLASGTYFYRIEAGDFVDVKKMVIVK